MTEIFNNVGSLVRQNFKKLIFPMLIFVALVIVLFNFSELAEIGRLFSQAKWYWLVVAFLVQILNFVAQGNILRIIFKVLNLPKFKMVKLTQIGIAIISLNYIVPSLGVAGFVLFSRIFKKYGVKEGRTLMLLLVELICYYSGFIILLLLSLIYLFFKLGNIGHTQVVAVIGFSGIVLAIAGILYYFLSNKERARKRIGWIAKKIDLFEDGVPSKERSDELVEDLFQDFKWMKKNKRKIIKPIISQLTKFACDGLTIYFVFLAFGVVTPIGLGLVAFALGRLFGLISFIPGGVGPFEGSMVLIFNSLGYPLELALSVMLVYRLFSFWIYFPLGLFFYKKIEVEAKAVVE